MESGLREKGDLGARAVAVLLLLLCLPGVALAAGSGRIVERDSIFDPVPPALALTGRPHSGGIMHSAARSDVLAAKTRSAWGGTYTTSGGQRVTMLVSDLYAFNEEANQSLAEWISTNFYYGPELATAVFVVLTHDEVAAVCGPEAYGCYSPDRGILVVPGEHYPDMHFMSVMAHEYGHHVAVNRDNAPWSAGTWGPKRWASYVGICGRVAAGTAFPGDQGTNYWLNPGEVFAESYAHAVNRNGGWENNWWPAWPWSWDQSFTPDSAALEYAREDAVQPWTGPEQTSWTGVLSRKVTVKTTWVKDRKTKKRKQVKKRILAAVLPQTYSLQTAYDGLLSVTVNGRPDAVVALTDPATSVVLAPASSTFTYTVCGQRSLRLKLVGRTPGAFSVTISKP